MVKEEWEKDSKGGMREGQLRRDEIGMVKEVLFEYEGRKVKEVWEKNS